MTQTDQTPVQQRLDKWLWFARIYKSRSLASKAVAEGAARITRGGTTSRTNKPSFLVHIGDVVTLSAHKQVRVLEVISPGKRRGPATEAVMLYQDLTAPTNGSKTTPDQLDTTPRPAGRPSKKDRRALHELQATGRVFDKND